MGVKFPDLQTLEHTAYAVGSNMFEGFQPTPEIMTLLRDFVTDKIQIEEVLRLVKKLHYD
jgi:putative transcriptional regulator